MRLPTTKAQFLFLFLVAYKDSTSTFKLSSVKPQRAGWWGRKISKIAKGGGANIRSSATILTQLWNFPGTLEKIKVVEEVLEGTGVML
jgi:hypothetical protein